MQVKQTLRLNSVVSTLSVLVILIVFILAVYRVQGALESARIANAIMTNSFERLILRTDLQRTGNERAKVQLIAKHKQIGDLLKVALSKFQDSEDRNTIRELLTIHESIGKLSRTIRENREKREPHAQPDALALELEDRLLSQLNMRVYETILLDSKLQTSSNKAVSSALMLAAGGILFVILLVSATTLVNSWSIGRKITERIRRLRDGAALIGRGGLEHRIDIEGDDEFTELSQSFNAMTTTLRESYCDLEKEIEERKHVEEELRKAHDELELRIAERTKELSKVHKMANAERQRLYAVLETLPVYVVLMTRDYHVPFANRFFRERFGESGGRRCYEYLFNRSEPCEICESFSILKTNAPHHWEWTGPDGRNYDIYDFPFTDSDGSGMILEMGIDITEQKQAEKALEDVNETLEHRIAERTIELQAVNAKLFDSRRAAINMMEDADIARRRAEDISTDLMREIAERKRAEEALRESEQRINILAQTAGSLLASDSPQQVVESLCTRVMEFLDCQAFFNFLVDENEGRLRLNACAGITAEEKKQIEWLDFGVAVCGCAARDAQRIVAEDIANTPDPRTELVKSYGIRAYACHPLMIKERVLGTISFGTRNRTSFSDDDLAMMKAVADQVAIAMERKRAEEALRHARDELELRVTERTKELAMTVETLLGEMAERELAEGRLQRLNRLYSVLSETDQAIVRAVDKESLFRDSCRIAVEQGGFILSWVGLVDEESGCVNVVAASGATAYLDEIRITTSEEPTGEGPTGIAIREGTYFICNDFLNAPCTSPWHEKGLDHGICASASVALKEEGRVIGALTLYAGVTDFFDQQHVDLLRQMGSDVSFALDNFTREERRRKTEQALREETLERLRAVEALREKEQLLLQQSRMAAMGEMINNIAHQWRQPLNVLGLNIQRTMLFYELGDFSGDFLKTSTDDAMKLIRHMSQTIDDFRNFFKTDKEKTLFSVETAVKWTISLLKDGLNSDHIDIVTRNIGAPYINGYFNEFCQVLLNIVLNARDVIVERKIAAGTVSIVSTVENNRTIVTITDNGGGIPEEIIDRIYEPYFSTKGIQGTGIGLFMSKTIIETNMAGRITVRNTGQGAEFRIEI